MKKLTKNLIKKALEEVLDPELNISVIDLGLIYEIEIRTSEVKILMTLTTIGCPLFPIIKEEVKKKLSAIGIDPKRVRLELTFDPPWSMDKMSTRAKAMLGI